MARHARENNLAPRLLTNGTLITEDVTNQIAEVHPLSVEVSIYGADVKNQLFWNHIWTRYGQKI